jgi:hypothetical protein
MEVIVKLLPRATMGLQVEGKTLDYFSNRGYNEKPSVRAESARCIGDSERASSYGDKPLNFLRTRIGFCLASSSAPGRTM